MNYNIIIYTIYLPIIFYITFKIGWMFYKNGEIFLLNIFKDKVLVKNINNLLLIGYYLINLGYAVITISFWDKMNNEIDMINALTYTIGKIIIILAILHYNNVFWLTYITKSNFIKQ